jgi:predicted transcriptional regulator of viral defense system
MGFKKTELIKFFKKKGGIVSYAQVIRVGFNKAHLKANLNSGRIQKVDRGLYRLSGGTSLLNPDLVVVSIKVPKGVVCLLSALSFYEATNEIPKYVDIAIVRGMHANKIKYPPVKFYRFAYRAWKEGIEKHQIQGHEIKVYSLAKTIADCFKFRNRIGVDVARSALKVAVTEKNIAPKEIMKYAKICRVDSIIKPILEAII